MAGEVVAAAVILDPATPIPGLNDSKKLSDKQRQRLVILIKERARPFHRPVQRGGNRQSEHTAGKLAGHATGGRGFASAATVGVRRWKSPP